MALPATIQTIVDLIGHGPAMALVRELGGNEFRFPLRKDSANWCALAEIIGESRTARLVEKFGGDEIYIALCDRALRQDRNARMIARYEALLGQGHSCRGAVIVLVQEFRPISNRQVQKIINGPTPSLVPEMVTQGSLF